MLSSGGVRTEAEVGETDRVAARASFVLREAGLFLLSLMAAWILINHRALFTFPPDLMRASGATLPTYGFLAILVDAAMHAAFLLQRPSLGIGMRHAARSQGAARPPTADAILPAPAGAPSRTALAVHRAMAAAERRRQGVVAREAIEGFASYLEAENPAAPVLPSIALENPVRPVRVVRRKVRTVPTRPLDPPGPPEATNPDRLRPGERTRPGP